MPLVVLFFGGGGSNDAKAEYSLNNTLSFGEPHFWTFAHALLLCQAAGGDDNDIVKLDI